MVEVAKAEGLKKKNKKTKRKNKKQSQAGKNEENKCWVKKGTIV